MIYVILYFYYLITIITFVYITVDDNTDFCEDEIEVRLVVSLGWLFILCGAVLGIGILVGLNFIRIGYYKYTCGKILRTHKWKIILTGNLDKQPYTMKCKKCDLRAGINSETRTLNCRLITCAQMTMNDILE